MVAVSDKRKIEFLVNRRFRGVSRAPAPFMSVSHGDKQPTVREAMGAYKAKLEAMNSDEINAIFETECAKEEAERLKGQRELQEKVEKQEQARFFNRSGARADTDHWSKAAYWSLDEATALSFGRAPEVVKWENVKNLAGISAFASQYMRLRDLLLRAKGAEQLFEPIAPGFYIAWAKRNEISFPPDLEAAVVARGQQIADWRSCYDDLKEKFDEAIGLIDVLNQKIRRDQEIQNELQRNISELKAIPTERGLLGKERDFVLKLIIGMAVKGYAFDPAANRTKAISEITSDLEELGLALSDDTVRKWLKEAGELLPPPES